MDLAALLNTRRARKTPVILQAEVSECGLACLAMVFGYHGYETDLATLRAKFSFSLRGMTLSDMIGVGSASGFTSRPLKVDMAGLERLQLPAVLHWDLDHFVVMTDVDRTGLAIHDPAIGARRVSWDEASNHFTGVALELTPAASFSARKERRTIPLTRLAGRIRGIGRALMQILVMATTLELLSVLVPLGTQWVVDEVIVSTDGDLLTLVVIGLGMVLLTRVLIQAGRSWALIYLSTSLQIQWVTNLFSHLLRLPMDYFEKRHVGDLVSRFNSVTIIRMTLASSFIEALLDGLMTVGTLTIMFIYSPLLASISVLTSCAYLGIQALLYPPLRTANEEELVHGAREQTSFIESIRGVQSIKLYNAEDDRRSRWLALLVNTTNRRLTRERISLVFQAGRTSLFGCEAVAVLYLGAHLIMDGSFSVGMFIAYSAYRAQFAERVGGLVDKLLGLRMLGVHADRLSDIVLTEREVLPEDDFVRRDWWRDRSAPGLEVRNLRFRYSDREPWVLDDVSFKVEPGEAVAIVGPSGCGKTTLVKVMLGLLTPQQGEMQIDGVPIRQVGLRTYRAGIAAVMQDDALFAGSIAQNIAFFASTLDMERVTHCAKMASIHNDIQAMPMCYETLVGDLGTGLSGGQKQRVLIARALYKNPRIMFLDEATSHLDLASERIVNAAIRDLSITRLIIAHRPDTIALADRVIRIENGRVATISPVGERGQTPPGRRFR